MRGRGALVVAAVVAALGASVWLARPRLDLEARAALIEQAREAEAHWDTSGAVAALGEAWALDPASFPELPRLVYLTSLAHDADLMEKARRMRALVTSGEAAGTPRVGEARVVALSAIVNEGLHREGERSSVLEELRAALPAFEPPETSEAWYHLAEARILLGDLDGAEEALVTGSRPGEHTWEELIQLQALLFLRSRRGEDVASARRAYFERLAAWEEPHFAWRMALADFVTLDARVWGDASFETPPVFREMAARAEAAGVATQVGNAQLAAVLPELFSALDAGARGAALARVRDLLTLLARDRGCVTETALIRPHLTATLLTLRGDLLSDAGEIEGAQSAWKKALVVQPDNPWIAERMGSGR